MPKGHRGTTSYGTVFKNNPREYHRNRFQAIKADPEKYAARKAQVNAQRRGKRYGRKRRVTGHV
jgi:hypothetical protein